MARDYLKKASKTSRTDAASVTETVREILDDIAAGGDEAAMKYAAKFDGYNGPVLLSDEDKARAATMISEQQKDDIKFAHDNIRKFAETQKSAPQR